MDVRRTVAIQIGCAVLFLSPRKRNRPGSSRPVGERKGTSPRHKMNCLRWRFWRLYLDVSDGYLWIGWRNRHGEIVYRAAVPVRR